MTTQSDRAKPGRVAGSGSRTTGTPHTRETRATMTKMHLMWFCAFSPHAGSGLDGWAGPPDASRERRDVLQGRSLYPLADAHEKVQQHQPLVSQEGAHASRLCLSVALSRSGADRPRVLRRCIYGRFSRLSASTRSFCAVSSARSSCWCPCTHDLSAITESRLPRRAKRKGSGG